MTNIKLEKIFRSDLRNGERMEESKYLHSKKHFDNEGRVIKSEIRDQEGGLIEKNIIRYNEKGLKTENEYYIEEDSWSEKSIIQYEGNDRIKQETIVYPDTSEIITTFEYENDNLVSVVANDPDEDEITEATQRKYDEKGNLLKEEKFEYGELISSEENSFDDNGNLINKKSFTSETGTIVEESYSFENDKIVSWTKTHPNGLVEEFTNIFNDKGQVINVKFKGAQYNSVSVITYDENNHVVEEKEILENDTILFRVQRKFDNDRPVEVRTFVNRMGQAPDLEYVLDYEYE